MGGAAEVELGEVEHEIRELERLLVVAEQAAPSDVRFERSERLERLRQRRDALIAALDVDELRANAMLTHPGLWEPLPLYAGLPESGEPGVVSSPEVFVPRKENPSVLPQLVKLGQILESRPGKWWRWVNELLTSQPHPLVARVATVMVSEIQGTPHLLGIAPPPMVSTVSAVPLPQLDGLTSMQRQLLTAHFLSGVAGDRVERIDLLATHVQASSDEVVAALLPLSADGGARYPLLSTHRGQLRLTAFAEDIFVLDPTLKSFWSRVPLLVCLGHSGNPPAAPHNLAEVVEAMAKLMKWPKAFFSLAPDFVVGGRLSNRGLTDWGDDGWSSLSIVPSITVSVDRAAGYRARIEIRELPVGKTFDAIEQFVVTKLIVPGAIGPVRVTRDEVALFIEVEHVAFVKAILAALRSHGLTHRTELFALHALNGTELMKRSLREVLLHFIAGEKTRVAGVLKAGRGELELKLHLAEGLVVAATLHELVDQIIASADDAAEAVWGLRHLRSPELKRRPVFSRLQIDLADLQRRCDAVTAEVPELLQAFEAGFSEAQALALLKERRLGAQKASSLRHWQTLRDHARAEVSDQAVIEAIATSLDHIVARHGDPRRTDLVGENLGGVWRSMRLG